MRSCQPGAGAAAAHEHLFVSCLGLRVTCVQPGNVATPLLATSTDPEGIAEYGQPSGAKVRTLGCVLVLCRFLCHVAGVLSLLVAWTC